MDLKRSYEVSIWSLQDEFITVLKPFNVENIGQLESKEVELKTSDGVHSYSCSIPMYIYSGVERIDNPIWCNTINGNIVANMRKIKVIFNKFTEDEEIYEFLIIKTEERHEKDNLYCDITCEDLAYNELGKIGYKISLLADDFEEDYKQWEETQEGEAPIQSLQYWNNKFLTSVDDEEIKKPNKWYYDIQMNWSSYKEASARDTKKVYEEEYTSSWELSPETGNYIPKAIEYFREKARPIDIEESNIYNITQKLAETFEVFCKYQYLHDSDYHIIGRRIIYYNNYLQEQEGYLDITYPYSSSSIKREQDSSNITTKMFIRPVQDETSAAGLHSIVNVEANKSQEDYLLNFEYMRQIGAIGQEQYQEISNYETKMGIINRKMAVALSNLQLLLNQQNKLHADETTRTNEIDKDAERIQEADNLLNNIDSKDFDLDGAITIGANKPDSAYLLRADDGNSYYINLKRQGILRETLHIYLGYNYISPQQEGPTPFGEEITGTFVDDEYGDIIRVENIIFSEPPTNTQVYLTYKYAPKLKNELVKKTWTARLAADTAALEEVKKELYGYDLDGEHIPGINEQIESLEQEYDTLNEQKLKYISDFEEMMGPALRESYWQPEDTYTDIGDKYEDILSISSPRGVSDFTTLFYDSKIEDGEQNSFYNLGINETKTYYPCIDVSNNLEQLRDILENASFMFYDFIESEVNLYETKNLRQFALGSLMQLGFAKVGNSIKPILILTGAQASSDFTLKNLYTVRTSGGEQISPLVGVVSAHYDEVEQQVVVEATDTFAPEWLNVSLNSEGIPVTSEVELCYPRIQISSLLLKTEEDNLDLFYDNNKLNMFYDFSIFQRIDERTNNDLSTEIGNYYLSIKPEVLFKYGLNKEFRFYFSLSNANTSIYLDAIRVLKENSMPKLTYTIEPSLFDEHFSYTLYKKLNCIANINDVDLKLENVQGYISSVSLNLDEPWKDKIEIKNYRNKFEDLFSSIVAQTEAMQKNSYTLGMAAAAFTSTGSLAPAVIQNTINQVDLDYAFNQGNLTIDEENGIWATSDDGVVAMRGGGIFTATEKDEDGNWKWNTGILPSGINASLITTGQLDTNLIRIYAGDKLRFQMNGDGLYAYKSVFDDDDILDLLRNGDIDEQQAQEIIDKLNSNQGLDLSQYVVHNENGLFLKAQKGSIIQNDGTVTQLDEDVDRVEISWDGLKLRNWDNKEVFYADPDTGNLTLEGRLKATSLVIEDTTSPEPAWIPIDTYIEQNSVSLITLNGAQFFRKVADSYNPSSITLTATPQNCNVAKWYRDGVEIIEARGETELILNAPTNDEWSTTVIKVTSDTGKEDYMTIYVLSESGGGGGSGTSPSLVHLTNENISLPIKDGKVTDDIIFTTLLRGMHGNTQVLPTLVSINGIQVEGHSGPYSIFGNGGTITLVSTPTSAPTQYLMTIQVSRNTEISGVSGNISIVTSSPVSTTININWTAIQSGEDGASPTLYELVLSDSTINKNNGTYTPSTIVLKVRQHLGDNSPIDYSGSVIYKVQSFKNNSWSAESTLSGNSYNVATSLDSAATTIRINAYVNNQMVDSQTIPVVSDGVDGYTVILSNENHTFSGNETGAIADSTSCSVTAYKGVESIDCAFDVSSIISPTGMTISGTPVQSPTTLTISTTSSLSPLSGVVELPVIIYDGTIEITVNKSFSYSVSLSGLGITEIQELYYLKTTISPAQPTQSTEIKNIDIVNAWTTVVPTYQTGGKYYRCLKYIYSDNSVEFGEMFIDESMSSVANEAITTARQANNLAASKNTIYRQSNAPATFNKGDIWYDTDDNTQYMATDNSTNQGTWVPYNVKLSGTKFIVDTEAGEITMLAQNNIQVAGGQLDFIGNSGVNIGSGGNINIASGGSFAVESQNFSIDNQGDVNVKGGITATSLKVTSQGAEDFNTAMAESELYQDRISEAIDIVEDKREALQTITLDSEGLKICVDNSPYHTVTTNSGYSIKYNSNDLASFTNEGAIMQNLRIGDIIVKQTSRNGWIWVDA